MALSDAERARLYRERKQRERDAGRDAEGPESVTPVTENVTSVTPEEEFRDVDVTVTVTGPPARRAPVSLEDYLRKELRETRAYSRRIGEDPERARDRLKRSEKYLRWRYQGFLDGEVAGL